MILCTHRWYDPTTGRWVTRDPIGMAGGMNLYEYCGGDPVNRVDINGLVDSPSDIQQQNNPFDIQAPPAQRRVALFCVGDINGHELDGRAEVQKLETEAITAGLSVVEPNSGTQADILAKVNEIMSDPSVVYVVFVWLGHGAPFSADLEQPFLLKRPGVAYLCTTDMIAPGISNMITPEEMQKNMNGKFFNETILLACNGNRPEWQSALAGNMGAFLAYNGEAYPTADFQSIRDSSDYEDQDYVHYRVNSPFGGMLVSTRYIYRPRQTGSRSALQIIINLGGGNNNIIIIIIALTINNNCSIINSKK